MWLQTAVAKPVGAVMLWALMWNLLFLVHSSCWLPGPPPPTPGILRLWGPSFPQTLHTTLFQALPLLLPGLTGFFQILLDARTSLQHLGGQHRSAPYSAACHMVCSELCSQMSVGAWISLGPQRHVFINVNQREGGRKEEEREKHWLVASHMCPDWGLNPWSKC